MSAHPADQPALKALKDKSGTHLRKDYLSQFSFTLFLLTSGAFNVYIFVDKASERRQSVMSLAVTTEVHAKHASFFSFEQIKRQKM